MKVYSGGLEIVSNPSFNFRTNFGKGFYTTTDLDQTIKWSKIKEKRLRENGFEYNEDSNLNILFFQDADQKWLEFLFSNRQSDLLLHQFDIVKDPVANDNLYQVLVNYENDVYDIQETIKRLKTYLLTNQISFPTALSLSCLKYIETIEVGDNYE